MDAYHIALFVHLVTLIVAASATAITKLAVGRRIRARTAREALEWHDVLISASKAFPICLLLFFVSGAYMVGVLGARAWSSGFVVSGLVGVSMLLGSGIFLGVKAKGLRHVLQNIVNVSPEALAPRLAPPPLVALLPVVNTGIALAVVFDMVTKPASVLVALGVIAFGVVASGALALRRPRPASARAEGGLVGAQ